MEAQKEVPVGTILFSTASLPQFGFDIFSVNLPSDTHSFSTSTLAERRHTDGVSVNFNAQFADESGQTVAFVSERTGSARLFLSRSDPGSFEPLLGFEQSFFHDRPSIKNGRLYFVSAHEKPSEPFKSWAAVYSSRLHEKDSVPVRVTPTGMVDMSPALSESGDFIAVASYGSRQWKGDFRALETEVAVFRADDPAGRLVVSERGGWPAWCGDSAVYYHRVADDGWWSVFRVEIKPDKLELVTKEQRVTPPGVHCMTPAASHDGRWIAVATRRKNRAHRHIELFDVKSERFFPVTELLNLEHHHYNPFISADSGRLGYHRFRGESAGCHSVVPHLQPVRTRVGHLTMLRVNDGTFPSFSSDGKFIAMNGDFLGSPGLMILRSDGSKKWTLMKDPMVFYTAWSTVEEGVIFTSMGPIFDTTEATVRIARVSFNLNDLTDDRDEVTTKVEILTRPAAGNDAFPSVSPCGQWVVFRSGRSGHKNLYIIDAVHGESGGGGGNAIRRLTNGNWIDTMPNWSPNGELITFSSNRHDPSNPNVFSIYMVRPDGSDLHRVHVAGPAGSAETGRERINHVCFSPDSKWLLFTANFGGVMAEPISGPNQFQPYGDLYACRLDGTGLVRLTCNAYENGTPAWGLGGDDGAPNLTRLSLGPPVGEKLEGRFDEPLWLTCDI